MAVLKMRKIHIYAMIERCKDILELLQRRGVVEIEYSECADDPIFFKENTSAMQAQYLRSAEIAKEARSILSEYLKEKNSMLSTFKGKKALSRKEYNALVEDTSDILRTAYDIISYNKDIERNKAEELMYEAQLETIRPWLSLDVPMTFSGTAFTKAFIGKFAGKRTASDILSSLFEADSSLDEVDVEVIHSDPNQTCVFIICGDSIGEQVSSALRKIGFEYPNYLSPVIPKEREKEIQRHINHRQGRILENENNIKALASFSDKLDFLEDYYVMKADRYRALDEAIISDNTFIMTGFIADNDFNALKSELEDKYEAYVESEESDTKDTPIKLKNNRFSEPVESVLATYSYPSRGETDPTTVMSIFYYIFFGMMFSDAGYGLVMALACGLLLLKNRNMNDGLRRSVKMFFWCGVSTTIWGLLFGSFFGDAVTVISQTFFSSSPPDIPGLVTPIWFNPISDPMKMLMFAFLLGIIHLFVGLGIQAYNDIKSKEYLGILYDVISWYLLVGGAILALLSLDMMKNIAGFILPPIFMKIGGIMAAVGAVIILIFSGRESKNPIKRFLKGLYGLYGVTGYLSDILSYSRLLALGLATGVIAQVFNQIGSMPGKSVVGVIVFCVIFIIGHLMNIGINALGAYVHTNRLQFVEFFGKFYKGGGREFKPFKINTKHFVVKE